MPRQSTLAVAVNDRLTTKAILGRYQRQTTLVNSEVAAGAAVGSVAGVGNAVGNIAEVVVEDDIAAVAAVSALKLDSRPSFSILVDEVSTTTCS